MKTRSKSTLGRTATIAVWAVTVATPVLSSCGGSGDASSRAKAVSNTKSLGQKAKIDDEALKRRKAEREAKEQAKEAERAAFEAQLDAVAVLPAKMPKDIGTACKKVAEAHNRFMEKHLEGTDLEKWKAGSAGTQSHTVAQCKKHRNLQIAACQSNALDTAGPELAKEVTTLFGRCIEKFSAPPPKPG